MQAAWAMATGERVLFSEQACCAAYGQLLSQLPAAAVAVPAMPSSANEMFPSKGFAPNHVHCFAPQEIMDCSWGYTSNKVRLLGRSAYEHPVAASREIHQRSASRVQACDGGLAEGAFEYIMNVGGVRLESDVPYRGESFGTTLSSF